MTCLTDEHGEKEETRSLASNPDALAHAFPSEKNVSGWTGYVEWGAHPDRIKLAEKVLAVNSFTPIPGRFHPTMHLLIVAYIFPSEFQLAPLPDTNPILIGHRWKEYHAALGPSLAAVPDQSWEIIQREKRMSDMLTVLDFPFNGEPNHGPLFDKGEITPNDLHFIRYLYALIQIHNEKWGPELTCIPQKPWRNPDN